MKLAWLVLLGWLVFLGCSTPTVESRKKERPAEYSALPDEQKRLVDKGQIKVGMNSDAVYLAWGPPAEILENESESGHVTTWIYHGQWLERRVSGPTAKSPTREPRSSSATSIAIIIRGATFAPKSIFKTEKSRAGELYRARRTDVSGRTKASAYSVREDAKELEVTRDICAPGKGID